MSSTRRWNVLLTLISALYTAQANAQGMSKVPSTAMSSEPFELTLLLDAELDGEFARPFCRRGREAERERYARQVALRRSLETTQRELSPVVLSAGDMIFPGALTRHMLTTRAGAARVVALLEQMGYDALALGNQELAPRRADTLRFIEAAAEAQLPLQAANLRCQTPGGAEAICDAVGTGPEGTPARIITRGPLRIGILSVVDPALPTTIAATNLRGLEIAAPADVLPEQVAALRAQGADVVIVQLHVATPNSAPAAMAFASEVEGIDLLVTSHSPVHRPRAEGSEDSTPTHTTAGHARAAKTGTYIVGAGAGVGRAVVARLGLAREGDRWRAVWLEADEVDAREHAPDPRTLELVDDAIASFCDDWGKPIGVDVPLTRPFGREDFQTYVLNLMRFETSAEVALINRHALRNLDQLPLTEHLTYADIYTLLPFDNELTVIELRGEHLGEVAAQLGTRVIAEGLTSDGEVRVNGRALDKKRTYRVVLNRYVADGGDGIIDSKWIVKRSNYHPSWSPGVASINALLARELRRKQFIDGGGLDPTRGFPDLSRRFLWTLSGALDASYNRVAVTNPVGAEGPAYSQSQLNVKSTDQLNLDGQIGLEADQRDHRWDTNLRVQYAQARVDDGDPETEELFEETKDLLRLKSAYEYAGFQRDVAGRWWVPLPLVEGQVQSEFDPPLEQRGWRIMELTGIVGARYRFFEKLRAKVGLNARQDINAPESTLSVGLNLGYSLERLDLAEVLGTPLQVESELDYFFNDVRTAKIHEVRSSSRLYYALLNEFFFTTTLNIFAYRSGEVGEFGRNVELTFGLNYQWDASRQSF